jgi:5-methylcytosine-specific restriction endonuclease McrBC regulatory subunit McrC
MRSVARQMGGTRKVGRRRETVSPLAWDPPYLGSQRSLVPDMILDLEGRSFIIDAKYKRHWEELQQGTWHEQATELHERHREDLLQMLAYANLVGAPEIVCCLVYPSKGGDSRAKVSRVRKQIPSKFPDYAAFRFLQILRSMVDTEMPWQKFILMPAP